MNNPFSTDQRIKKLETQIEKYKDREAEVAYKIKRYVEAFRQQKWSDKKDAVNQIIDLCDGLWTAQDTSSKLAETHRQEWSKCADQARNLSAALFDRDNEIIDIKVALRDTEQDARIKVREHKEETRNFLNTIGQLNDRISELSDRVSELKSRHEAELRLLQDDHGNALEAINAQHQYDFEKEQRDHAWAVQSQREHYEHEIANRMAAYEQELLKKEVECAQKIASLEADLLSNSDDFRPATDDVLKVKYRKL